MSVLPPTLASAHLAVATPQRSTARERSEGSPSLPLLLSLAETAAWELPGREKPQQALKIVQEDGRLEHNLHYPVDISTAPDARENLRLGADHLDSSSANFTNQNKRAHRHKKPGSWSSPRKRFHSKSAHSHSELNITIPNFQTAVHKAMHAAARCKFDQINN